MIYNEIAYLYDGSLDGFLTVIFTIYERRQIPSQISPEAGFQLSFGQQQLFIETDEQKAKRVQLGIFKKGGELVWHKILCAFLSTNEDKDLTLFYYIRSSLKIGKNILNDLANENVIKVEAMAGHTWREFERWMGFLRFSKIKGNIYYAAFEPLDHVTPLLMPHFAERFSTHPFLIHDINRHLVGIYDTKKWFLTTVNDADFPKSVEDNLLFEDAWRSFYQAICNPERKNPKLQQNLMPKRYRHHMTEFHKTPHSSKQNKGKNILNS